MNEDVFEKLPVPKAVLSMAVPTILGMLVSILYNLVDTFFIGQTGDPNQVAAISLSMPIFFTLMALGNIFGVGGSSLISRFLGAGERQRVRNVSAYCFWGCILIGAIFTIVALFYMEPLLKTIGTSKDTIGFTRDYLRFFFIGAIPVTVNFALGSIIRAEGAAKPAMIGMLIGTVINIILNPIMIMGLGLGVKGSAIATVIANIIALVYYINYFINKKKTHTVLSISPKDFMSKGGIAKEVLKIGIPSSIADFLMGISAMVFNIYLASYGDYPIAAMGISSRCFTLPILLQIGLALGLQPLVGYNFAAGNYPRMKACIRFASLFTFIMGTAITAVFLIFAPTIIRIFIDNAEVISLGTYFLRATVSICPVLGIYFIFTFSFQAMGKALPSLILAISRQGFVFIPAIIIGNSLFGLHGIVWAGPLADAISLIISVIMFMIIVYRLKGQQMKNRLSLETGNQ